MGVESFTLNIAKTGLFHGLWVDMVAYYSLLAEFASIALLLYKPRIGSAVSLLVMLSFTLYILFLKMTGRYVVCGCGGILNGLPFQWHFLINIIIVMSLLFIYRYEKENK